MQIVDVLNKREVAIFPSVTLSAFDLWKVNKLASKLAGQFLSESFRKGTPEKNIREYLISILTTHKLCDLNLNSLKYDEKSLFTEIHHTWLPTYQSSLQEFDLSPSTVLAPEWHKPETYYGKFAKACEPFLAQLHRELISVCAKANTSLGINMFGPQLIEDIQNHLLNRFELPLAWAIEVDANVYCARNGIDKSRTTEDDYTSYLDSTFSDKESYHCFYLRFPTLGRWLAQITRFLSDNGRKLIERLRDDAAEISDAFFGKKIVTIRSLKFGKSDYHVGSQSVALVEVELADSDQGTFVYKPRCLRSEVAMQGVLDHMARDGVLNFATHRILSKEGYGYTALIPPRRNHVESSEEAGRIYEELGGYLGLFYVLGGSDMHFENLLVADGHAFICDGETILGVLPFSQDRPLDTILDSVYKTGLLEWPRIPVADAVAEMRISGYTGGESFQIPFAQPRINDRRLSFELSVKHEVGIRIDPDATNRIYLDGRLAQPEDFKDWILNGFNRVHEWFQQKPSEAIQCISELFEDASIRFISWGTQVYTQLLLSAWHPKCLMEPLEIDLIVNSLKEHPRKWDQNGLMAECELASLWQLDIPIFTVNAQSRELVHDHQTLLPITLAVTPIEYAAERIKCLSSENRLQQVQYVTASLSLSEMQSPSFIASAVDYAQQIGWQLCKLLRAPSERAPWKSYQVTSLGISEIDIQTDLYNGAAGIALFLAYLDAIAPQQEFRHAAERAMSYSIAYRDGKIIGAFQGLAGLIYLLIHLHHLWKKPKLLDMAVELSRELSSQIEKDRDFDVLSGTAGVIPVMIGLAEATSGDGLDYAHRCAQHLLQHAERKENGLSWPLRRPEEAKANLTGFAHGAGGIGWALISLGCVANLPDYIVAGKQAFIYEALYFDENEQDWYDLRTQGIAANQNGLHFANAWCNGAAGIGLSRIASWAMLGKNDDDLLKEAHLALAATLRGFHRLGNDTLCHGKAGNAELFLRFAKLKDEPAFQMEANVQAQAQWRNFEKANNWIFGGIGVDVFPGLMLGLAGLGMHFLRLAYPEQVPSSLLLDFPKLR
jgi:type 2 lantibiotic biosynthesis protein LanM